MNGYYHAHEFDVLVIGAGGAGLRAAIEASRKPDSPSRPDLQVPSSARRTPSWPRAAWRPPWGTRMIVTPGRRTSRTPCEAGMYLNNSRMPGTSCEGGGGSSERELEAWGAVFDRTPEGRINQRKLRRPQVPPTRPRRRPDGPGDDPDPSRPRNPPGIRGLHGIHRRRSAHGRRTGWPEPSPTNGITAPSISSRRKAVIHRHRRRWAAATRSPPTPGKAPATVIPWPIDAGATKCGDMEFLQFHPTGMVWPPSASGASW